MFDYFEYYFRKNMFYMLVCSDKKLYNPGLHKTIRYQNNSGPSAHHVALCTISSFVISVALCAYEIRLNDDRHFICRVFVVNKTQFVSVCIQTGWMCGPIPQYLIFLFLFLWFLNFYSNFLFYVSN